MTRLSHDMATGFETQCQWISQLNIWVFPWGNILALAKVAWAAKLVKLFYLPNFFVGRVLRLRRNTHWQEHVSFDSLLSRDGLGHLVLGKGWVVRGTTTRRLPYWANGSSTRAGTGCTDLQLIGSNVADCQALTWPQYSCFLLFLPDRSWQASS